MKDITLRVLSPEFVEIHHFNSTKRQIVLLNYRKLECAFTTHKINATVLISTVAFIDEVILFINRNQFDHRLMI